MRYALTAPLIITARLMPGVVVAEGTDEQATVSCDAYGEAYIDGPGWTHEVHAFNPSPMDAGNPDKIGRVIGALLSFLQHEGETYRYNDGQPDSDGWLFDETVAEWAYMVSDELAVLAYELECDE